LAEVAGPQLAEELSAERLDLDDDVELTDALVTSVSGSEGDRAEISGCVFRNIRMPGVRGERWRLTDSAFETCDLASGTLAGLSAARVAFVDCRLSGVVLTTAILRDAAFVRCQLEGANLSAVRAERVLFDECTFAGAYFSEADLRGAEFKNCRFGDADITKAKLSAATFPGSSIEALQGVAALRGATISSAQAQSLVWRLAAEAGITVED
jgi:uncharacterized protein YjbI with pentapeptide repeats